jgi:hypothetical protein
MTEKNIGMRRQTSLRAAKNPPRPARGLQSSRKQEPCWFGVHLADFGQYVNLDLMRPRVVSGVRP